MIAPIDVSDIVIETERLILRPWQQADLQDLYEYAKEEGVGEMAGWAHHASVDVSKRVLGMFMEERKTFALVLKESGSIIGSLGLENPDWAGETLKEKQGREVGYVLSRDYWGRGLMPEAVRAVIDFCFQSLQYDFLTCAHSNRNSRSRRVIEKCGFQYWKDISYDTQLGTKEASRLYILYNPNK